MVIGFDARPVQPGLRHWGIGMVVDNIVRRLSSRFDFLGFAPRFENDSEFAVRMWPDLPGANRAIFEISPWFDTRMDIYWGSAHVIPAVVRRPSVLTTHDLVLLKFPKDQSWGRLWAARFVSSLKRATKVVTDSVTTANDLVRLFPQVARKVEVALLGYDSPDWSSAADNTSKICREPFAIMLGAHRARKNLPLAIAAVDQVRGRGLQMSLFVTGNVNACFQNDIHKYSRFVKPMGVLKKGEIFALLRQATALVFPSVYEGFGFPMLEAMAAECPVLALDTQINREIGGSAARFLPAKPELWAESIVELAQASQLRREMIEAGKLNLQRFSWEETTRVYSQVFDEAAS